MHHLGIELGLDDEFGGEQALGLVLSDVGAVDDIGDELWAEGEEDVIAVDVALVGFVDEEEVVAGLVDADVGVLADLDIALSAEDEEATVAPGTESVGGEPVEADVAETAISTEHHVAEVLEFGVLRMVDIGDLRGDDVGLGGAGVVEELIDLMGADVAEDAAVKGWVPEPVGAGGGSSVVLLAGAERLLDLVGGDVDGLNDTADGTGVDEFSGFDGTFDFEALAVHYGVDALGFRDGFADFGELFKGGDAGLVAEEVFAALHDADAEWGAATGDGGAEDELDGGIVEDLFFGVDLLDAGEAFGEGCDFFRFLAFEGDEGSAAALDGSYHAVDVVVAHAADGKFDGVLGLFVCAWTGFRDFVGDLAFAEGPREGGFRKCGDHAGCADCLEERTSVDCIHLHTVSPLVCINLNESRLVVRVWAHRLFHFVCDEIIL